MSQQNYETRLCITENKLQQGTTKQELQHTLGCTERTARELISEIAHDKPVIAVSTKKGYFMLPPRESLSPDMVAQWDAAREHAIAENIKRAKEILKRNVPLERW